MNRFSATLVAVVLFSISAFSQNFINAYTNKTTFSDCGVIDRIVTDNMNNVINSTVYSGSMEVGGISYPASGILNTMIIKRDNNDSLLWAKSLGCGYVVFVGGMFTDNFSNIYVTGYFGDSLTATTLNCSPFPISNPGGYKSFVIKYAPNGTVLWSNSINIAPGPGNTNADMYRITGNGTDKIAITSQFYGVGPQTVGTSTIDPSTGNLFYAVIDDSGNWQHASVLGGTPFHFCASIAMATNEEIFIAGEFTGTLILGVAGTYTASVGNPRDFILKADATGNFAWAKMLDASSWWRPEVVIDNLDVYMIGSFGGTINLGSTMLTATSFYSTYMTKIDNTGNYLWAKKYGNSETHFYTATKKNNRIYISGYTDPSTSGNQFDTLNLVYANSLPLATTYSAISYLLETDLNGNALKGAAYSFDFPTLNTQSMSASNTKTYLVGNAGSIASFGGIVINPVVINSANYVAVFSDSANVVSGKTYYDLNSNSVFDAGDANCSVKLTLTKGTVAHTTMANGDYKVGTDQGTYISTITDAPLYYTYTPTSYTSNFVALSNQVDSLNNFAFQPVPGQNDLVIDLVLGQLRPGFSGSGFVTLKNIGTTAKTGSMTVILNNPDITITACVPTATSIVINTATLAYSLTPTQQITYVIQYYVAPTAILSSNVLGSAAAIDGTDLTPSNNIDSVSTVITGAYDPNFKEVFPAGDITSGFVASGNPLEYVIHFQNTGTDTAFTVVLIDTISSFLNLSTFEYISSSHPVHIDFYGNEVWFRFYNILLVDSTTNEPLSHGFVKYSIAPLSTCALGDEINNTAYIYFDYNTPIVTNTTSTIVSDPIGINENQLKDAVAIYPNPNSTDFVNVKSNAPIQSASFYNVTGQLIKIVNGQSAFQMLVNTNDITAGVYFIKVTTAKGDTTHKLVILD